MKEFILIGTLQLCSFVSGLTLLIFIFSILPTCLFIALSLVIFLKYYIDQVDKEFENRTPENIKLIEDLYDEIPHQEVLIKPELIQVSEMYRDSMQGTASEGSIAWMATTKAIDNYYKQLK